MTMANWNWTALALTDALVAVLLIVQPYMSRSSAFGVFIPEGERGDARIADLRRRYAWRMGQWAVLALAAGSAAVAAADSEAVRAAAVIGVPLLQIVAMIAEMSRGRRAALRLKEERGWQVPASSRRVAHLGFRQRVKPRTWWYVVHLLVIALCAGAAILQWDRIPDVFPSHYNFAGEADRYSNKTIGDVFALNFVQLGMTVMFVLIDLTIRQAKQSLDPTRPEQSMEKHVRLRQANSAFLWGLSLAVIVLFGAVQGQMLYSWPAKTMIAVALVMPLLIIGSVIAFAIYLARSGLEQQPVGEQADDRYWRAGGNIYYNPNDPSIMVDKKVGIGMTFNFARPASWFILLAIIGLPILVVVMAAVFLE